MLAKVVSGDARESLSKLQYFAKPLLWDRLLTPTRFTSMFDNQWIGSKLMAFMARDSLFAIMSRAILTAHCIVGVGVAAAGQQVLSKSGERFRGHLTSSSARTLQFVSRVRSRSIAADQIRKIIVDPKPVSLSPRRPLRRFHFSGCEILSGELVAFGDTNALLLLRGKHRIEVSRSALSEVWNPHGEIDVVYEDFEEPLTTWKSERGKVEFAQTDDGGSALRFTKMPVSLVHRLPTPVNSGRASLRFYDPVHSPKTDKTVVIFRFAQPGPRDSLQMEFELSKNGYRIRTPPPRELAVQPLRRVRGWHRLSVAFDQTKLMILIDDAVLATGRSIAGQLVEVRIQHSATKATGPLQPADSRATAEPDKVLIDDFTIRRFASHPKALSMTSTQDVVVLASGDKLYGDLVRINSKSIRLDGQFGIAKIGWPQVVAIKQRRSEAVSRPVSGLYCRIQFQSPAAWQSQPRDVIFAAIQSATKDSLHVEHPLFGRLEFHWDEIRQVEPLFDGTCLSIDPRTHHLGDEVREHFRKPLPDGNALRGEFELDDVTGNVAGQTFQFVIEVDNLEPSGPKTPPGTPFLKDLHEGFLITELFINGKKVDVLNRHIVYRTSTDGMQRIRVPVPPGVLKPGRNWYRLRQQSSRSDPDDFDDCEVGRIQLWVK